MGVRGVWGVRGVRGVRGQRATLVLPRQPRLDPPVSALRVSFALTRQISRVRNALAWRVARMCLTLLVVVVVLSALGQMKRGGLLQDARPGPAKPAQYHAMSRPAAVIAPISDHLIWVAGRIHQLHDIDSLSNQYTVLFAILQNH